MMILLLLLLGISGAAATEAALSNSNGGCPEFTTESECVESKDGRKGAGFTDSPCAWCCGMGCASGNVNKCEPTWLLSFLSGVAPYKNGAGVDQCASTCQPRDFVNSNSSPSIVAASTKFTRNADIDAAEFGNAGSLQFQLRLRNFAELKSIEFQNDAGDANVANSVIGFTDNASSTGADPDDACYNLFTSSAIAWSDFSAFLTLKPSGTELAGEYEQLHYRAEIVVLTNNPYDATTTQSQTVDALTDTDIRFRDVTTSFQLYFTLPEFVQAHATIEILDLPDSALEEHIQVNNVSTTLARDTLLYTTEVNLRSKINWPYKLTSKTTTADEADTNSATTAQTSESATCTRHGNEDDEAVCEQTWLVTVTYASGCGADLSGTIDLTFERTNVLPNLSGSAVETPGTSDYSIVITANAVQCAVNAGDIDTFAELATTGSDFQIGGEAVFTLTVTNAATAFPGVDVAELKLYQVRTTQLASDPANNEARQTHFDNYAGTFTATYHGDGGASAVTANDGVADDVTGFTLNLHQTLFNLDAFLDGSSENLLVDATAQISYASSGRRRRRLMNTFLPGSRAKSMGDTIIKVSYNCEMFSDKKECKAATGLKCRWSKRSCRTAEQTCKKLGAKQCKKSLRCLYKQKTKTCKQANMKKLKCADIANTLELCQDTPGCLTIMSGKNFKACRGMVKSG